MDYQITIDVDTPEEAEAVMGQIKDIVAQIAEGGGPAALKFAQTIIHKRSGRLSGGTELEVSETGFRLTNNVYYGPFVDKGHRTPSHFKSRPAKHISMVPGQHFSDAIWQFIQDDIQERESALLELK